MSSPDTPARVAHELGIYRDCDRCGRRIHPQDVERCDACWRHVCRDCAARWDLERIVCGVCATQAWLSQKVPHASR